MSGEIAAIVRSKLTDPHDLCNRLQLLKGSKRQHGGVLICCPVHGERNPSCSVTLASDGTIRVKCFACDFAGDALTLVSTCTGLSIRTQFREVLAMGAELAGDLALAFELRDGVEPQTPIARPESPAAAVLEPEPRSYPSKAEVEALWADSVEVGRDAETVKMLMQRGFDFGALTDLELARVITAQVELPGWAMFRGRTWVETGHRLILPAFDARGVMMSVRAWRVVDGDTPKRLPPAGHKQAGLVQANLQALQMLRRASTPPRLWVVEGEPDFFSMCLARPGDAVIGVGSGSWTADHAGKVPRMTEVMVATHRDRAGDKYAQQVSETIGQRCLVRRWGKNSTSNQEDLSDMHQNGGIPDDFENQFEPMNERARKADAERPKVSSVRELLKIAHDDAVAVCEPEERVTSGHWEIDRDTGGFQAGYVWLFGAKSHWGKSSSLVMFADENIKRGKRVLIVSAEDPERLYGQRLLMRRARVDRYRMQEGRLSAEERTTIANVTQRGENVPVFLNAIGKPVEPVCKQVVKLVEQEGIDLVAFDYLHAFDKERRIAETRQSLNYIARTMTDTVKNVGVAGIIYAQVTPDTKTDIPDMYEIRDSKDVVNAADVVAIGYQPKAKVERNVDGQRVAIAEEGDRCVVVAKNKPGPGPAGRVYRMGSDKRCGCFEVVGREQDQWIDSITAAPSWYEMSH